jgi:arsenite methyltransferase
LFVFAHKKKGKNMELKEVVRERYGQAALRAQTGESFCCGASATPDGSSPITSNLYDASQTDALPEKAVLASLGCAIPRPWRN